MLELKDLQENFKRHLIKGDSDILPEVISTDKLSNVDRLAIYGNAYYARLEEALEGDFEAIHTLLGDEAFSDLCRRYIDAYPSRFFTLRWFGQYMSEFLRTTPPYSQHPYLYEMAVLEWRFTDAFDALDTGTFNESDIVKIPPDKWPTMTLTLHPSVSWFTYCWNILPVWKAIKDNEDVPVLKKLEKPKVCLVWRQELTTRYRTIDANEALLIKAVEQGKNFSHWCELLIEAGGSPEEVPMIAAGVLKTWIGLKMISSIHV